MLIDPYILSSSDDYDVYKVLAIDFLLLPVIFMPSLDIIFLQSDYMVSLFLKSE